MDRDYDPSIYEGEDFCSFCEEDDYLTVYKTENFQVRVAIGPIAEGYCLIIPNDHHQCMGASTEDLQEEYLELKAQVRQVLEKTYGSCLFYEHGRVGVCDVQHGEQLCYHAHIHCVPLSVDILPDLEKDFFAIKLDSYRGVFELSKKLGHYLLYEDKDQNAYMFNVNRPIRSQYLRYYTASSIGKPHLADWRSHPGEDMIAAAREKYLKEFQALKTNAIEV